MGHIYVEQRGETGQNVTKEVQTWRSAHVDKLKLYYSLRYILSFVRISFLNKSLNMYNITFLFQEIASITLLK
jgi:hypothetical protein